jgi:glycerate dehydrogenase
MRIVLVDSYTADLGEAEWPGLNALGTVSAYPRLEGRDLGALCSGAGAIITNKVPITAALMAQLTSLRYVGVSATGVNIVDVDAARVRGIAVTNVPAYSAPSVAQMTLALLLQLTLDVAGHGFAVKEGAWASSRDFCFFLQPLTELAGKTIAIVGMGAIGRSVARIAEALGMKVIAAQVPGSPTRDGRVPLAQALPASDVITLHCPLVPETAKMVNRHFLSMVKPGAILLNTSRGGLVDELDVVDALKAGTLGGVGLDVLAQEPPGPDHPLLARERPWSNRVLVTPHIAWGTVEARERLRREAVLNLAAFLRGESRNRID